MREQITAVLQKYGVSVRFFQGSHNLDGISIMLDQRPQVAINTSISLVDQWFVTHRELSHILLNHLSEGKCSMFLSTVQRREAEANAAGLITQQLGGLAQ